METRERRAKGSGYVGQRKDGTWVGQIDMPEFTNRKGIKGRRRKAVYGKTREEVERELERAKRKLKQRGNVIGKPKTVGQWLDEWLRSIDPQRGGPVSQRTFIGYRDAVRKYIEPGLGHIALEDLSVGDVQDWQGDLAEGRYGRKLSAQTIVHMRAALRRALKKAEDRREITFNPAAHTEPPDIKSKEFNVFTLAQAAGFEEAVKGDPEEALYVVALASGFRQGELLGLRWKDVDLDAGVIAVNFDLERVEPQSRTDKDARYVLSELKTKGSKRKCVLEPYAAEVLRAHRTRQVAQRIESRVWLNEWDLVFTDATGRPLDGTALTRRFQAILKTAGLPRLRFHDLRHSFAVFLLEAGEDPRNVAAALGHTNPTLVFKTYGNHIRSTAPQSIASAMARARGRG